MDRAKYQGFLTAAVTAYDPDHTLSEKTAHALMEKNIREGARGFLIGGSSGEGPLLSHQERERQLEIAASYPRPEGILLMGAVSAFSTEEAITYAKCADRLGYDAIISTVPYYYKFGSKGIAGYFRDIREHVDRPLFLYNFPGHTGIEIDIEDESIQAILQDGTISGVKQTSLNLYQMERIRSLNPELVIYGGYDEVYLGARILGADGAIGSTFNFTLPLFLEIERCYQSREIEKAQKLQKRANNIMQTLVHCSLFPSIKYVLSLEGIDCGPCRSPFPVLSEDQKACIRACIKENMPEIWKDLNV